jgi:NADH-quinone oxidoreductase subunit G
MEDRIQQPMLREEGGWRVVSWDEALDTAANGFAQATSGDQGHRAGALVSPSSTTEEGFLLARLMQHLGSSNVDFRLRRRDVRCEDSDPLFPWLGMEIAAVEKLEQALIVGSNLRGEVPLLAHRVRKAALSGAGVYFINPEVYPYLFRVGEYMAGDPADFWKELGSLLGAAVPDESALRPEVRAIVAGMPKPAERHGRLVKALRNATRSAVFLGHLSQRHPRFAEIDLLAAELSRQTGSTLGYISEGANASGLALAGALPHRQSGGRPRSVRGLSGATMLEAGLSAILLFGVEPEADCANAEQALAGLSKTAFVVACTSYMTDSLRRHANVVLPIATFAETSGTFVNAEGRWQNFDAVAQPVGQARPGWKVLRVLGNRLGVPSFDYDDSGSVIEHLRRELGESGADNAGARGIPSAPDAQTLSKTISLSDLDVPMYQIDALVRRSAPLQQVRAGESAPMLDGRRRA